MKKINPGSLPKNMIAGIFAATMIFAYSSCANKAVAVAKSPNAENPASATTPLAPENRGQVQVTRDINSNYVIQINLRELEELSTIEPSANKTYVVWMEADKQSAKNLGQINSNTGWLSDKSKAFFEATSVLKPTKVFISEETAVSVQIPGSKIIWSSSKF